MENTIRMLSSGNNANESKINSFCITKRLRRISVKNGRFEWDTEIEHPDKLLCADGMRKQIIHVTHKNTHTHHQNIFPS